MSGTAEKAEESWGRFERHAGLIPFPAQELIWRDRVAIVGMGGIGGAVAFLAAKAGFGNLTVCDFDRFEEYNILEQAFATTKTVGRLKAEAAAERLAEHADARGAIRQVNLKVLSEEDALEVLDGASLAVSGVDDPFARIALARAAKALSIPLVLPVNIGWTCFVTTYMPGGPLYESRLAQHAGMPGERLDIDDAAVRELVLADWDAWAVVVGGFDSDVNRAFLLDGRRQYPYTAYAAFFAGSLGCRELMRLVTHGEPVHAFPRVSLFDLRDDSRPDVSGVRSAVGELLTAWKEGGRASMYQAWLRRERGDR